MVFEEIKVYRMKDYRLGGLISYLLRAQSAFYTQRLKPYNISYGQFPFLMALYREDGVNQETIAKRLLFNKATIARAIDKLERRGYVSRTHDEYDGRANRIFLTSQGWEIKPFINQLSHEWNSILLSGFTENERLLLKEFMKKIVSNVMHEMEHEDITVLSELMK
jgi:DNA-binding MarR family transcriptional regulator